ncbi:MULTISPECIES: YfgM family protein [Gammaproteobacteria]|uniref:Ancillary SecYEG translocon subunit n=1 Tax=Vreelandella halophila TaxID=86177 RepID=A0A9X4YE00_9GAMM|nr:tetratricopeptide repeat protein [Halospina sp. K52047b]KAA8981937.1 tetratricopeptide repeat protein [Halospina sp. K52047b]MYL27420.1 tetratricopeptide repeat protein [Halomonas utahensis]MYL74546.1 tetratricopeptide repeat protein [Halomonas sp. 22501_18_FS]
MAEEDEQWEAFKRWWKQNGSSVLMGIAIVVLGIAGWQYWEAREASARAEARQGFDSVISTLQSDKETEERLSTMEYALDNLKDSQPDSPYTVFSAMVAASVYMEESRAEDAVEELEWALEQAGGQPLPRVIRLRLARAQLASGEAEGAIATLEGLEDAGEFAPLFHELRGDAHHAAGNEDAAREAYQAARESHGEDVNDRLLEIKLSDLAVMEEG